MKYFLIVLPVLFVLWIVGLFNGLKLTPAFEEDYYVDDVALSRDMILADSTEELMLQIPWDSDSLKAIDLTIFPGDGVHKLSVDNASAKVLVDGKELNTVYFYVFTSVGEKEDVGVIKDFPVGITDDDSVSTYVQFRSVYVLDGVDAFELVVDAEYVYDGEVRRFHRVLEVEHARKLRWRGLRLPGGDH